MMMFDVAVGAGERGTMGDGEGEDVGEADAKEVCDGTGVAAIAGGAVARGSGVTSSFRHPFSSAVTIKSNSNQMSWTPGRW
jgi:hypothetical protein